MLEKTFIKDETRTITVATEPDPLIFMSEVSLSQYSFNTNAHFMHS